MELTPPPRDEKGNVIPHDHEGILSEDFVIRRIPEHWVVQDEKIGGKRISSMAFRCSSGPNGGMSVDLKQQIEEAGLNAKTYVTTPKWIGSMLFQVGQLRTEEYQVGYDPLDDNPYHGEVWGKFTKGKQNRLRELCEWFVPIDDVSI